MPSEPSDWALKLARDTIAGKAQDISLYGVLVPICDYCLRGAGGECHTPGCVLYMNRAPDVSIRERATDEANITGVARALDAARAEGIAIGLRVAADKVADNAHCQRDLADEYQAAADPNPSYIAHDCRHAAKFADNLETQIRAIDPAKLQEQT